MATEIKPLLTIAALDLMSDDGHHYETIEGELFCKPKEIVGRASGTRMITTTATTTIDFNSCPAPT